MDTYLLVLSFCDVTTQIRCSRLSKNFKEYLNIYTKNKRFQAICNGAGRIFNSKFRFYLRHLPKILKGEFCWRHLSQNPNIPVEFFEKYINDGKFGGHQSWAYLLQNPNIPVEFFEKYINKIEEYNILGRMNPNISVKFFENHIKDGKIGVYFWTSLFGFPNKEDKYVEFIEKYMDKVDEYHCWSSLCENPYLPIEFFEKHINKFDNALCWDILCKNPNKDDKYVEFIEKHMDKVDEYNSWRYLCSNPKIPVEFFEKYIKNGKVDNKYCWEWMCKNPNIPVEFFEKYIKDRKITTSWMNRGCWKSLSKNPNIPFEFFEKYIYIFETNGCLDHLCINRNPKISVKIFEKYIKNEKVDNKIRWKLLFMNSNIPVEFLEKYIDKIDEYDCWYSI